MIQLLFPVLMLFNSFLEATPRTYFTYSADEKNALKEIPSDLEIGKPSLTKWNALIEGLDIPKNDGSLTRLKTYVFVGQEEGAALSEETSQRLKGSLDPVTLKIIQFFHPLTKDEVPDYLTDRYSEQLSQTVINKLKERFESENSSLTPYPLKTGANHWVGKPDPAGISIGHWKPWILEKGSQFRAPPPVPYGSPQWKKELEQVQIAVAHVTPEQKERILFWNGDRSPKDGDWYYIATDYMDRKKVPLSEYLRVRAQLAMVYYDAMIAVFDSKYEYAYPRPINGDPHLKTVVETPNHPSYPAGHSTVSMASATFLSDRFPENKAQWMELAEECGLSRIWAGLHYPMDHKSGVEIGQKVANAASSHFH